MKLKLCVFALLLVSAPLLADGEEELVVPQPPGDAGTESHAIGYPWEDLSTTEDGVSPATCTDARKHCVFKLLRTRQLWTAVTLKDAESGLGELREHEGAVEACKSLTNWGGYGDWRLPTLTEMTDIRDSLYDLVNGLNKITNPGGSAWDKSSYFWTRTALWPSASEPIEEQDPERAWGFSFIRRARQIERAAPLTWICTRNEVQKFWEDKSTLVDGKTPTTCSGVSDKCLFEDKRSGLLWTETSPGVVDNEPEHRLTRQEAERRCKQLTFAGHKGFRLPTILELERAHHNGILLTSLENEFFGVHGDIWSSSSKADHNCHGGYRYYSFSIGHSSTAFKSAQNIHHSNVHGYCPGWRDFYDGKSPIENWVCVKSASDPMIPPAPDGDGDGVTDEIDQCPNTPKGKDVWTPGEIRKDGTPIEEKWYGCASGEKPKWYKPKVKVEAFPVHPAFQKSQPSYSESSGGGGWGRGWSHYKYE